MPTYTVIFTESPKAPVLSELEKGRDVILEIDVQGAMQVKETYPDGVFIFVLPPSMKELRRRIEYRGTESQADIELRMGKAEAEMEYLKHYEYFVVNDDLEDAVAAVRAVMKAERRRSRRGRNPEEDKGGSIKCYIRPSMI